MKKPIYLAFDTETCGTDPDVNGIIQIGGVIFDCERLRQSEIKVLREFNITANAYEAGCEEASWEDYKTKERRTPFDVHGISNEVIATYQPYRSAYTELKYNLGQHIDKFDKTDKLIAIGYNIEFDMDMLFGMAKRNGDKYLGSYISRSAIDVMPLARWADALGVLPFKPANHKLETMCEGFDIEIKAHDALSDIKATMNLLWKLNECLNIK